MEKRTSADSDLEGKIVLILYLKYMKIVQMEGTPVATVFMGFVSLFFKGVPHCPPHSVQGQPPLIGLVLLGSKK